MKIVLRTLKDSEEMPYPTCGNWEHWTNGDIECTVVPLDDPDAEFLVLLHELCESYLCRKHGVKAEDVCEHDIKFESEREMGKHSEMAEPGDDERAPYRREHQFATMMEMIMLHELGGSWPDHCQSILK
jgi:hypothetical protein